MKILYPSFLFVVGIFFGYQIFAMHSTKHNMQEYQIRLELDSAYIYDGNRLVGSCKYGSDGIDSVLFKDNL